MGRIDICMEVSAMLSFIAAPRYGHFLQVLHILGYLKCHHGARLLFDPWTGVGSMGMTKSLIYYMLQKVEEKNL